jgi:hypothetical protein
MATRKSTSKPEGKKQKGTQLILDGGVLLATSYQDIRDSQVFLTGAIHYNEDGTVRSKNVYTPQSAIPASMRPGGSARAVHGHANGHPLPAGGPVQQDHHLHAHGQTRFLHHLPGLGAHGTGRPPLPRRLQVRTARRGRQKQGKSGEYVWYAQGFGVIMMDKLDRDGDVQPAYRIALTNILSAP